MTKYISHSQMETWQQCRFRWFLEKVERAPRAPSEALILGDAIHQAIEADGRSMLGESTPLSFGALAEVFDAALQERLRRDDPTGLILVDAINVMYDKADAVLRAYVAHIQPTLEPVSVEQQFEIEIEGTEWIFTGRIDAEVVLPDGTLSIIDYKSGKPWTEDAEHRKPQASAYMWEAHERSSPAQSVTFVLFPVESHGGGDYACTPQVRTTTRTDEQIADYVASVRNVATQMERAERSGDYPATTGPLCAWCNCWGSCKAGRYYLERTRRKPMVPEVVRKGGPL